MILLADFFKGKLQRLLDMVMLEHLQCEVISEAKVTSKCRIFNNANEVQQIESYLYQGSLVMGKVTVI